jgi:HK97 family phage portal protein
VSLFRRSLVDDAALGGGSYAQSVLMQTYGSEDHEQIQPTFTSYVVDGYASNAVVFSVILARLMLFSEAEFKWQSMTDRRMFGSPDLALLEQPWPGGSTGELLARMEQDVSLAGNSFVARVGALTHPALPGVVQPARLRRLRPDRVTIVSEEFVDDMGRETRVRLGYMFDECGHGRVEDLQFFDVSEVAHWSPIPDPLAEWRGMSWLTPVAREIDADTDLTQYKVKYLQNAATPNLLIRYEQPMTNEALDVLKARFSGTHEGVRNAFRTLVLDRGADATVIGSTLEQMNFTSVQAAGENRIAAAGGVPGIVVGLKEGLQAATYSNYEQAMRRFSDITMRPLWRSACAALQALLVVPAGARLWFDTSGIAALRQGEMERAQTFQVKANTAGYLIQNGYAPDSVARAIDAGDLSLLTHTGSMPGKVDNPQGAIA